jgi:hypothetical protein
MKKTRRTYTRESKLKAIRLLETSGKSAAEIEHELGIVSGSLKLKKMNRDTRLRQEASEESAGMTTVALSLLLLSALGQLYNNIAIMRVADFAVTIPLLLFAAAALVAMLSPRQRPSHDGPLFVWMLLVLWQLLSGVLLGLTGEADWLRSVSLFFYNSTCFVLASRLQVSRRDIVNVTPMLVWLILLFGGLGVLQFLLLNLGIRATVPKAFAASRWDPTIDIYRTAGLQRAAGISLEPSIYALGLSLVMVIYLFFYRVSHFTNKRLLWCAMVSLIGGLVVSFSVSGIVIGIVAILVAVLVGGVGRLDGRVIFVMIVALVLAITAYCQNWFPALTNRVHMIASGSDRSANVRVVAALQLLFLPPTDFPDFVIGQGLGMESNYRALVEITYGRSFGYHRTDIHNIITVIKVTQGWMGVALHFTLLLAVFRPFGIKDRSLYAPLFVTVLVLHFASGYYLVPLFWAILALVAVLRRASLEA